MSDSKQSGVTTSKANQHAHKDIPEEVRELIPESVLKTLKPNDLALIIQRVQTFSGPLPHPELLGKYGDIKQDFPERIVKMAENHNSADIRTKDRFSFAMSFAAISGTVFSFLLGISGVGAGIWLAQIGYSGASIAAIIGGIAPILIASLRNFSKK
jgi:uncharacterized membrane protein